MKCALSIDGLSFSYDGRKTILTIDGFTMDRGERLFLHGPSGSGKTTFLGIVAGILSASSGTVEVLGKNLTTMPSYQRDAIRGEHLGYIFQQFNLIPYLSVIENIILPCRFNRARRDKVKGLPENKARELCDHLGILPFIDQPVTELSVGQQQRVAACRALIGRPELIIADEPTSALDSAFRKTFIELLFKESKDSGSAILFVSHDLALKDAFDRVVALTAINRSGAPS